MLAARTEKFFGAILAEQLRQINVK